MACTFLIVDATYKFILVDIRAYGRNSDGGVLAASNFGQNFFEDRLNLPRAKVLPDAPNLGPLAYAFVADEAFPIKPNMMRPYPGGRGHLPLHKATFNYRLLRSRRIVKTHLVFKQHVGDCMKGKSI